MGAAVSTLPLDGSLARLLALGEAERVPELVSPAALARARAACSRLPAGTSDLLYLECRLRDEAAVDLVLRLTPEGRDRLFGAADAGRAAMRAAAAGDAAATDAWDRVRSLCARWADPRSLLHRAIDHLWLELDLSPDAPVDAPLVPGVFVCFGEEPASTHVARDEWLPLALGAVRALGGDLVLPALRDAFVAAHAALPRSAHLPYVGVMLGRPRAALRLCATSLPAAPPSTWLAPLADWGGDDRDALIAALADAQPAGALRGAGMLHLDVDASGVWRVGLEHVFQRSPQARGALAEAPLLDALVARDLCAPAKSDALRRWPGHRIVPTWTGEAARVAFRRVNHVKLVFLPGRAPEAKAYLAVAELPRTLLARGAPASLTSTPELAPCS